MPAEVIHTSTHVQKGHPQYSASITTRVRSEDTGVGDDLRLNPDYFKTIPGILKLVQILIAVLGLICISPPLAWFSRLLTFVFASSFAVSVVLTFCYLVSFRNVFFPKLNWLFAELLYTSIVTLLYIVTSIIHLSLANRSDYKAALNYYGFFGSTIAAGVFGLLHFLASGAGAYFLAKEWRETRQPNIIVPAGHA